MREGQLKKNLLLAMLLMLATMTFAACSVKTNTDAQTDTFKTKSGKEIPSPLSNTAASALPLTAGR